MTCPDTAHKNHLKLAATVYSDINVSVAHMNMFLELLAIDTSHVVTIIEVDSLGNFHTREDIYWGKGRYPGMPDANGNDIQMAITRSPN